MAASSAPDIKQLTERDVGSGMALSTEAGWNQIADDWRHFIHHGQTFGVRDPGGRLVASAAALPYDGPYGFVGMVLVTPHWRRQGLATRLVDRCVLELQALGKVPVLDATADGVKVYGRQGFLAQFDFDRWQGHVDGAAGPVRDNPSVQDLDADVSGARRDRLMADFLSRPDTVAVGDTAGFGLIRNGWRALQAGPVIASDEQTAITLVDRLFGMAKGQVFIDVPSVWRRLGDWLRARSFEIQRSFTRMALGRAEPFCSQERLFAVAGPEFG